MLHDTKELIHLIYKIPNLKKLSNYKCFENILKNIDKEISQKINSFEFKNGILILVVKHPSIKMLLKSQMEFIYRGLETIECNSIKDNLESINFKLSYNYY